ncbi:MAG: tRNA (adenosine(37)-N6)-threonylcarbamoyltransferase complex dimerization subunit type 1 TsaB [Lachnospiraceae bacterium]|nr:tRNA (adenosine(37)-N6)-threonylcarbamoyltransferase complex dimerization subunit type 1 TsaB [Lachnospiraceae bacterium]
MKILALDSSGLVASVALVQDGVLLGEYTINHKKTHSQTLLPMLEQLKGMTELQLEEIDAIAVASGPGSFTGLRIGSATAKGLGLALDKPLVEVPTLEGLAYQFYGTDRLVCPLMDARRNQVYTGIYEFLRTREGCLEQQALVDQCAVDVKEIIERVCELCKDGREVIFLGDGVPVYEEILRREMKVPYVLAPAHKNRQSAAAVAALAEVYYQKGKTVSAAAHQPDYLRLSQAERERNEQQTSMARKEQENA